MKFRVFAGIGTGCALTGLIAVLYFGGSEKSESPTPIVGREITSTKVTDASKSSLVKLHALAENKEEKNQIKAEVQTLSFLSDASRTQSPTVQASGESYVVLPTVRAVKSSEVSIRDQKNVIASKFGYTFLKNTSADGSLPRVVYNERTQQFALLTGVFKINLKSADLAHEIGKAYDLTTVQEFPHLKLALFQSATDSGLQEKLGSLRRNLNVTEVELEILENQAAAR